MRNRTVDQLISYIADMERQIAAGSSQSVLLRLEIANVRAYIALHRTPLTSCLPAPLGMHAVKRIGA